MHKNDKHKTTYDTLQKKNNNKLEKTHIIHILIRI